MPSKANNWTVLALALLGASSCGQENPTATTEGPGASGTSTLPGPPQREGLDAEADGWSTETVGDTAKARLTEMIELGKTPSQEQLISYCDKQAEVQALIPVSLETLRDRDGFLVKRGAGAELGSAAGPIELSEALAGLFEPFDAQPEVHIKTTGVEMNGPSAGTTEVLYQASGLSKQRPYQQSATWSISWNLEASQITRFDLIAYEEVYGPTSGSPLFTEHTAGVFKSELESARQFSRSLSHIAASVDTVAGSQITSYEGVAIGDANGDGLEDIFFSQAKGMPNKLYLQRSDGTVFDSSRESGVDLLEPTIASLLVDIDGDGDQDLIASGLGIMLFENEGNSAAEPGQPASPIYTLRATLDIKYTYSITAVDYDLDRDLDLYICRYNETRSAFPTPYHDAKNGPPNTLLRNDGPWSFSDVTEETGLDENNTRYSFAASWADYDSDGDPDLYVANDFGRNNLYENDGGHFSDVAPAHGVEDISAGMSVDWGDPDSDGDYDVYVGNMYSAAGNRIAYQRQFQPEASEEKLSTLKRHARGNTLFLNQESGFTDESLTSGVTMGRWSWCSRFVDIDNDSMEDLVVANGYITSEDATHDL